MVAMRWWGSQRPAIRPQPPRFGRWRIFNMDFLGDRRTGRGVLCAAALAGVLAAAGPAWGQGAVRSVHADWQIRCDTPPGAQAEQCALIQSVTAEDRANVGLTVIVLK